MSFPLHDVLLRRRASFLLPLLALLGAPPALQAQGRAGECPVVLLEPLVPRTPRPVQALADIIGLEEAKTILNEAVVTPLKVALNTTALFWRSEERSAVLLAGLPGLGKFAAAEAAAAAAGASVLSLQATEVAASDFCKIAAEAKESIVVIIEGLEMARGAALHVAKCLRETVRRRERITIIATIGVHHHWLSLSELAPFGYIANLGLPSQAERKQYLLRLFSQISRVDARWASALRESAVVTLANITKNYTFAEIDLVVRRAFIRSTNSEGVRDPVALHQFEKILTETPPQTELELGDFHAAAAEGHPTASVGGKEDAKKKNAKKKPGDKTDPMDGIFGWCNFWLPEALHLPPVVWAMLIFGILAHFMARSSYQPYGNRKKRGGENSGSAAGSRNSSFFGDLGGGSNPYSSFGEGMGDWQSGGYGSYPAPPGMRGPGGEDFLGGAGDGSGVPPGGPSLPTTKASKAASFMPKAGGKSDSSSKKDGDKIEVCD